MPRPPIDLGLKVRQILAHNEPLPPEASAPLSHYKRTGTDTWNLLQYVERGLVQGYPAVAQRHLNRLQGMLLVSLIENFERFLKEIAAVCIDCLGDYVLDDRFNVFKVQGSALAAHFGADTLGHALCESATWLHCDEINDRFRKLMADPFQDGSFYLFPKQTQPPAAERGRFETLGIVWQIRHSVVHNVGVITQSDAIKLRLLSKTPVESPRMLSPTRDDLRYLKRFLDETAETVNNRVGRRLAELLTIIHADIPILFNPQDVADRITGLFGMGLAVAGNHGTLPP